LQDDDFSNHRLFIRTDGKHGPAGNIMNSPWGQLLESNPLFSTVNYELQNDKWEVLNTEGVSYIQRYKVAGYETLIVRLLIKLMSKFPSRIFKKEVILPNENELNLEIAYSLALQGVKVSKLKLDLYSELKHTEPDEKISLLHENISKIMRKRIKKWVTPSAVEATMSMFQSHIKKDYDQYKSLVFEYGKSIKLKKQIKRVVLMNAPGNIKGYAMAHICKKYNIPLISSQHGITLELTNSQNMMQILFDNTVADVMFSYNHKIVDAEKKSSFDNSKHYVVGMPFRLTRMKYSGTSSKSFVPIIYISTNLYHMGLSTSLKTDYCNALDESKVIEKILGKLPHYVCYKTYPDDNRRYADLDPVLKNIKACTNIEIFSKKIDMRYLISRYKIFVTAQATSTLGWPIMSGKPVVFINKRYDSPLTKDAHKALSKGIFVFDDDAPNFYNNLRDFLSQPIEEIEKLWQNKKIYRDKLIKDYFSEYEGCAGKRAARIILKEYMN
jgi:hypothetical protein